MTREKLKFNEDVRTHVPPPQLLTSMGGDVVFEYDHATYWPAMLKLAEERRSAFRERWVTGGKRIGENDGYLRGGEEKSVRETETATTVEAVPGGGGEKAVGRENGHVAEGAPDVAGLKIEG
ncbi:MAG: hypothetical protein M1833_001960 [Piccolia ochrophora]|nr:MAG: hypothetical protein M1833_001960 [Piccolia ochrophora]